MVVALPLAVARTPDRVEDRGDTYPPPGGCPDPAGGPGGFGGGCQSLIERTLLRHGKGPCDPYQGRCRAGQAPVLTTSDPRSATANWSLGPSRRADAGHATSMAATIAATSSADASGICTRIPGSFTD